jgi:hypothetical protein
MILSSTACEILLNTCLLNISLLNILPNKEWELRVITLKAPTLFSRNYKSTSLLLKLRLNTATKTQW